MNIKFLTPEDLSEIIKKKASTIRADINRKPHTLPPRFILPGSRRVVFLESDVHKWLTICAQNEANKK